MLPPRFHDICSFFNRLSFYSQHVIFDDLETSKQGLSMNVNELKHLYILNNQPI